MTKVVINAKHGGFGLSRWGIERYAALKGLRLYTHEADNEDGLGASLSRLTGVPVFWLVPESERPADIDWARTTYEERRAHNEEWGRKRFGERDIARDDSDLVAVVEEDAEKASGFCARLKVVEIPDDVEWEIDEYDGLEWVAEKHRRWD